MATTLLSIKDMLLERYPRVQITAYAPFPKQGQQQEDRFTGLEISGTPHFVRQIQAYLIGDDGGKFIQQTKKYYKQQEKKRAQEQQLKRERTQEQIKKIWPRPTTPSTSSSKFHPYPQLLFPDNPQYKMWS
jgi:hypothetical protein